AAALVVACHGKPAKPARATDAGAAAPARPAASAPVLGDGGVIAEIDATPIKPGDVLEGPAAETAMAEALAHDAGEPAPGALPAPADEAPATGLSNDGVAGYRLGLTRAEVVKRLGPTVT